MATPRRRRLNVKPFDLVDRRTFVVSPDEVDDRLIATFSDFGPNRRLRPQLGSAIKEALKLARERAKRKNSRAVGVYECKPYSKRGRETPAQFRSLHDGGCAIVGYTTTDENDHVVWTRY